MFDPITIVVALVTGLLAYHYIGRPLSDIDSAAPSAAFVAGALFGGAAAYILFPAAALVGLSYFGYVTRDTWLPAAKDLFLRLADSQGWDLQKFERRDRLRRIVRRRSELDATLYEIERTEMDPHYRDQIIDAERKRYTKEMADMLGAELHAAKPEPVQPATQVELTDEERQELFEVISREVRSDAEGLGYSEHDIQREIQHRFEQWLEQYCV